MYICIGTCYRVYDYLYEKKKIKNYINFHCNFNHFKTFIPYDCHHSLLYRKSLSDRFTLYTVI